MKVIASKQKSDRPGRRNAMSIDVEDYFHAEALASIRGQAGSAAYPVRVEANTDKVLALLDEHGVKATFFVLGWVADKFPGLVSRIVEGGHELAAHGYGHVRVCQQGPQAFRADIRRAREALEQAGGVTVRGYRAPTFSIGPRTPWAYSILAEEGFDYSSSLYPVHHDLYGNPGAPRVPFKPLEGRAFHEIPMSTMKLGGRVVQGGGGGYFRLLPYGVSSRIIKRINEGEGRPFMFYFHPWEIDKDQPRVSGLSWKSQFRHYTNLCVMEARLARLLQDHCWGRVDDVFEGARLEEKGL